MVKHAATVRIGSLLLIALLVGVFTVRDYGESWDEADNFRYADYAIQSYRYFFHPADLPQFETDLNLKGPAYFMFAEAVAGIMTRAIPAWSVIEARHFIDFVTFLAGGLMIYLLSRRWVSEMAALGATTLFLTQPLLWGHAFINPKDIPFVMLFSASVATGLRMVDQYGRGRLFRLQLLLASVLLGIATSVRVVAPFAALIVFGYGLWKLKRNVILLAIPYAAIAMLTTYLTWPYLWSSPIAHFLQSAHTMSDFPFATLILFEGHLYKAAQLPRSYFPTLLTLQLTEPMLILLALGLVACIRLWSRQQYREPAALFIAWFLIPVVLIIGYGSPLYDNGRQLYFLLPPLFVLAGVALDAVFALLARPWFNAAVTIAAVLPGLLLGIRLHPYEYVYYNILTAGTGGAYRKFEMDYWGISLMELTTRLNALAARDARVLVFGPEQIVSAYARPDIQVAIPRETAAAGYDYVMLLTRENLDERRCKGAVTVDEIERRGAVFAILKRIPSGVECE
ncbi:MAG TPA: phospholipid carrier-dependent glycosyltransferase [Anaerolineales bacterium]